MKNIRNYDAAKKFCRIQTNQKMWSSFPALLVKVVILLASMFTSTTLAQSSCIKQNLPVIVGGSKDEMPRCVVFDPANNLVIVGGITRSSDFGPANSPYGFLYAINLEGEWTWGNYFQNFTSNLSEITGCQLSSDGKSVVILGKSKEQVVMAVVNGTNGYITNLYSLENKEAAKAAEVPDYATFGAIMLDSKDPEDSKSYIYSSFLMNGQQ